MYLQYPAIAPYSCNISHKRINSNDFLSSAWLILRTQWKHQCLTCLGFHNYLASMTLLCTGIYRLVKIRWQPVFRRNKKAVGICHVLHSHVLYLNLKCVNVSRIFRSETSVLLRVGKNQLGGGAERRSSGKTQRKIPRCERDVGGSLVLILSEKCWTACNQIPYHTMLWFA